MKELPLTGRNFYTLVVLTPGVTGLPTSSYQLGKPVIFSPRSTGFP